MKTLTLNFEKWSHASRPFTFTTNRSYNRLFLKGYIWTPFVIVTWSKVNADTAVPPPIDLEEVTFNTKEK